MITTAHGRLCSAKTKTGKPCQGFAVHGSTYCFTHEPNRATDRARAHSKGGKARQGRAVGSVGKAPAATVTIASVGDVLKVIEGAINDCLRLENSISRARALGGLAGAALKAFEVSELEQRIAALEARLEGQK